MKRTNVFSGGGAIYNKKYIISLLIALFGIVSLLGGTSYAVLKGTNSDSNEQIIKTGSVELKLTENFDDINKKVTIVNDEEGLLQEETYDFNIKNIGDVPAKYDLKLINKVPSSYTGKVLDTKYIKIGLEINGEEYGPMSLEKVKNVIDSDIIYRNEILNYKLRIWLDKSKEEEISKLEDYKAFLKLKIEAEQRPESMDIGVDAKTFNYTGDVQEYTVPRDGYYYIEMAGAEGGSAKYSASYSGGKGGYTSGYVYLEANDKLFFYVGGMGSSHSGTSSDAVTNNGKGYNGGSIGHFYASNSNAGGGGGSTDVRLVGGDWNSASSLISRIMVAGGGGGGDSHTSAPNYSGYGGDGGALYGEKAQNINSNCYKYGSSGTQNSGGLSAACSSSYTTTTSGSFGIGGNDFHSGGGGGYYGGGSGQHTSAGGGSSYISGYAGANSVKNSTIITHTNNTLHYSGKYFVGGKMIAGANSGNGYAKISYVDVKPKKRTTKLNNVRYIKDCTNYNSSNSANHWVEIQAIKDGVNVAKSKTVTGTTSEASARPYSRITDGDITYSNWANASSYTNNQCVTVDLESIYDLDEVAVWNYFGDQRTYYDAVTYVSEDNTTYKKVIDDSELQTSNGRRINAYTNNYSGYASNGLMLWYDGYANNGDARSFSSTTWKDLSGHSNDVTLSGPTWNKDNLSFDGSNDYAYKTSGAVYNISKAHTIEVVLKPEKRDANYQMIFNTVNNGTSVLQYGSLWISSAYQIGFDTGDGSSHYGTTRMDYDASDVGKIIEYTNTRNNRMYKLYKNNSLQRSVEFNIDARTPNAAIFLGGSYYYFKGKIYSIRVYNRELSTDELLSNYNYDVQRFNIK